MGSDRDYDTVQFLFPEAKCGFRNIKLYAELLDGVDIFLWVHDYLRYSKGAAQSAERIEQSAKCMERTLSKESSAHRIHEKTQKSIRLVFYRSMLTFFI
jgi:predicted metal-dependent HD superfamily phosphohydrolase